MIYHFIFPLIKFSLDSDIGEDIELDGAVGELMGLAEWMNSSHNAFANKTLLHLPKPTMHRIM